MESQDGDIATALLTGKSKVAPVTPMSIPCLELSAAVLLSRLIQFVRDSISVRFYSCSCWTDSSVVLAWLRKHLSSWKTFVSNRMADINSRIPEASRRPHVPTSENPADRASRGLLAEELIAHELWWKGPKWLSQSVEHWPSAKQQIVHQSFETNLEMRQVASHVIVAPELWDLASRYSPWNKLLRVTAYILRFIKKLSHKKAF